MKTTLSLSTRASASTEKCEILLRFTASKTLQLRAKTKLYVEPSNWDSKNGCVKVTTRIKTPKQIQLVQLQKKVDGLCAAIANAFTETPIEKINKEWLKDVIDRFHNPKKLYNIENQSLIIDVLQNFIEKQSKKRLWADGTKKKFVTFYKHLCAFNSELKLADLTKDTIEEFKDFLLNDLGNRNSSVSKSLKLFKWFLRWVIENGHPIDAEIVNFSPRMKQTSEKEIIFLDWDELQKVYNFDFSSNPKLEQVRDVFCFCCFTSLRYSDVINLKRCNVHNNYINVVTMKTSDSLRIELNKYSKAILKKYKDKDFDDNLALPIISNQKMNQLLKTMACMCKIDAPITLTYFKGSKRMTETHPKYELISTHTARRTFICNSLAMGIPPEIVMKWTGHSDYNAMKPYIAISDETKAKYMKIFDK